MLLGKIVDGRYQVLSVFSSKELIQTYLAQDIRLPGYPLCIIKHLPKSTKNNYQLWQTARQILQREAEALKKLSDRDQIPQLLSFFEKHQDLYLIRKYIKGVPLSVELLSNCRWSEIKVIQLLKDVLEILKFIHDREILHLNIKPENLIKRESDNRMILINFGLSKRYTYLSTLKKNLNTTFIATQQNPKNDISALGLIGFQLLIGSSFTQLIKDTDLAEIFHLSQVQISPELVFILDKMVRDDNKMCYQSAMEVLAELQPLVNLHLPTQPLKIPSHSCAIAQRSPQSFSSQIDTHLISANHQSIPQVDLQMSQSSTFPPEDKSLFLIGLGIGLFTSLAFLLCLFWLLSATPKNQKKPVSLSLVGSVAKIARYSGVLNEHLRLSDRALILD
jgi:serine/threonine protein kinase, bacterial